MAVEQVERWEPVAGVETPVARAVTAENELGLCVTLKFSEIRDGHESDLRLVFGKVPAYVVHEEFVHPWPHEAAPTLKGEWDRFFYPLLIVKKSLWHASFSESNLLNWPNCIHYRLLTLDQIVDVLCNKSPTVEWIAADDDPDNTSTQ